MPVKNSSREAWMDARRKQLRLSWDDVAMRADISRQTLHRIRSGADAYPRSIRNVEAVLLWALGSISAIDEGGEPTVPGAARAHQPPPLDHEAQLRDLRAAMGPDDFRRAVARLELEDTDRHRAAGA